MNKETRKEKIYNVGDLVQFVGNNESSYIALIVNRQLSHLFDEYEYRIHFCDEDVPDDRWLFGSVFNKIMG